MKKLITLLLCAVMLLGIFSACAKSGEEDVAEEKIESFSVGYAKADITPTDSVPLRGYGDAMERFSEGFLEPMYTTCVAFADSDGTKVLLSILKTFFQKGGQTIHYNVLDTETLKDTQLHPENHQNLQVRVCGWNADFTKMTKFEQDEFILRSQLQQR